MKRHFWLASAFLFLPALCWAEAFENNSSLTTDLKIRSGAIVLMVQREMLARTSVPGMLGTRWRSNWEGQAKVAVKSIVVQEMADSVWFAPSSKAGEYLSTGGDRLLVGQSGRATLIRASGLVERFDSKGPLIEREDLHGNKVTWNYGPDGRLQNVAGPGGANHAFADVS